MSDPRLEFQSKLEQILPRVYYQPGEKNKLIYPCIVYERRYANQKQANNKTYKTDVAYWVTVISNNSENDIARNLINQFVSSRWQNEFISGGLYHSVFLIYYRI